MDKEHLIKFYKEKIKIKINLKNGKFFTGHILSMGETYLEFKDKYDNTIPIDYESVSYADPAQKGDSGGS